MLQPQAIDSYRRKPVQSRSEATVTAILEAAARILNKPAKAGFNTNAIAELAGISIGTLYQYFPDKNAILIALARHQLAKTSQAVLKAMQGQADSLPAGSSEVDAVRATVRAMIRGFGGRQRARKYLLEAMIANGLSGELAQPVEAAFLMLLAGTSHSTSLTPLRLFVMTRAVAGLLRAAVMEQSKWLEDPALEEEIVSLIYAYLGSPGIP